MTTFLRPPAVRSRVHGALAVILAVMGVLYLLDLMNGGGGALGPGMQAVIVAASLWLSGTQTVLSFLALAELARLAETGERRPA